ncbi:MAG TPA: hypothetical protein VMY99_00160 [Nevskiaceae bacterium]|nr:hypothetical protein [Nevskiaceae bacterium]
MIPEAAETHAAQLEQDRAAIAELLDARFKEYSEHVVADPDGTRHLTMYMPWSGGGIRGKELATVRLSRKIDDHGSSMTDLNFSARHAWDSSARVVVVDGQARIQRTKRQDGKVVLDTSRHSAEYSTAQMWRENLENATVEKPGVAKRAVLRLLGRLSLRG